MGYLQIYKTGAFLKQANDDVSCTSVELCPNVWGEGGHLVTDGNALYFIWKVSVKRSPGLSIHPNQPQRDSESQKGLVLSR